MAPGYGEWLREMDMEAAKILYVRQYPWSWMAWDYLEKVKEKNELYPNSVI